MSRRPIETLIHTTIDQAAKTTLPLQVSLMLVKNIREAPRNARTHSKKQIKQIANSILAFGWTSPILVDEHGTTIAGSGRVQAAIGLGLKEVPVIRVMRLSEPKKRALALADNKIAANAGWDRVRLASELADLGVLLPECNLDVEITGFDPPEFDSLLGDHVDSEQDPADAPVPVAATAVSRKGDLWIMGPHRLICGDAGLVSDITKLMGRDQAAMVFADPPFNVRISATVGRGKTKHREFAQASGEMSSAEFTAFLENWMGHAAQFSEDGSIHFICMDWRHLTEVSTAGENVYADLKNLIVWTKTNAGQGSFYRSQHEFIFVFKNGEAPHLNNIELGRHGRNRSNVWSYPGVNTFRTGRLDDLTLHPTVKPVALVADAMRDCSRRNDIVLDPFMGSGTTILAAERVGRRAYGLEIDPLYVDATIRRWQDFTKRDAILKATGETFEEVCAARSAPKVRRVQ